MIWRILKHPDGFFIVEKGVPNNNPCVMSNFVVYERANVATKAQATKYIKRNIKYGDTFQKEIIYCN